MQQNSVWNDRIINEKTFRLLHLQRKKTMVEKEKEAVKRCLNIARGCHDFNGGNPARKTGRGGYHDGIQAVVDILEDFYDGQNMTQVKILEELGDPKDGESKLIFKV